MKCLHVWRKRGPKHKLYILFLSSDMFASNIWPFPGTFGFWKPYCLDTMDRLWVTINIWGIFDGFSQFTFLRNKYLQSQRSPWALYQGRSYGFSPCWPLRFSDGLCQEETLYDTKNRVALQVLFFFAWSISVQKTGKFVARQQGLQLWLLLHFERRLLLLLLHRSLVCFFSFYVIFGMRFCCVLQEFFEVSGDFRIPQKRWAWLWKGQWMVHLFRRFITRRMGKVCWNVLLRCQGKTLSRYHTVEWHGEILSTVFCLYFLKCSCVEVCGCMDRT